jgi:hypothetical protein
VILDFDGPDTGPGDPKVWCTIWEREVAGGEGVHDNAILQPSGVDTGDIADDRAAWFQDCPQSMNGRFEACPHKLRFSEHVL